MRLLEITQEQNNTELSDIDDLRQFQKLILADNNAYSAWFAIEQEVTLIKNKDDKLRILINVLESYTSVIDHYKNMTTIQEDAIKYIRAMMTVVDGINRYIKELN
ncbi:MAG: hypothetical protein HC836_16665 [Richelia sp. RM2_1_2]|nr:hypothetical protein [Richelia sp. RM2_1_2]